MRYQYRNSSNEQSQNLHGDGTETGDNIVPTSCAEARQGSLRLLAEKPQGFA